MLARRTLSIVGASEDAVAHIRLLMRMAAKQLHHRWEINEGEKSDLILIEHNEGLSARALEVRCQAEGIPFAIICEQDTIVIHGMVLRRPLKLEQLVAILNATGALRSDTTVFNGNASDFYSAEFSDLIPNAQLTATTPWENAPSSSTYEGNIPSATHTLELVTDAFDMLVYGDPLQEPEPQSPLINENTQLEAPLDSRQTMRSENAGSRAAATLIGVATLDVDPISLKPTLTHPHSRTSTQEKSATLSFAELLASGAVLSPVKLRAKDLPDVTLDPKAHRYYTTHPLSELAPYTTLAAGEIQITGVFGGELHRIRTTLVARPYDELRWLDALCKSHGRLNPKLDPGGSYSIRHAFGAAPELRGHSRIAALMATPMALHDIARTSGCHMEEVFDIVNAYNAIGRIEYIPRQRLQPKASTEAKDIKSSLLKLFTQKRH